MCRGRRLSEHIFVSIRGCRAKGDYSANTVFSCLVRTEHGLRNARNRGLAWLVTAVLRIEVCESDVEQFRARAEAFLNDARSSRGACAWNAIVVLGILVSIGATFLETIVNVSEPENDQYSFVNRNVKRWQENVVDTFFLCELFARFSACESVFAPPDATLAPVALKTAWSKSPASRRQKKIPFALDVLNYLDLVAVLPLMMRVLARGFYNHQMSSFGLQWINMVKLLRAFKMMRSYTAAEVLVQTVQRTAVPLLLPGCLLLLMAVFFGSVVFMFEPCYNYDTCQFQSLWTAMYYGLVTMTTVGYGDQVPGNGWARATTVLMMLVGTFFLSMPLAIIGAEFDRAYNRKVRGKAVEARARELLKDWLEEMYPNFREHLTARQDAPSLQRKILALSASS
ncbi:hypothetical protein CTAYLR_003248 [Chrysophaeum taylorii]|uniref:Ion transport domain-containing protein n=1 Tax=Chrysophaeum taylorii TaxID=2483200 RepID=A0AAD7UAE9_9STRA|nr:hypothetical protein CTAYLR_003248 [Chrysophaeum taylorii]